MTSVSIEGLTVNETMEIVYDLRSQGYIQGVDFDFAYYPEVFDSFCGEPLRFKHAVFTFYVEKYATLFALKYSKHD